MILEPRLCQACNSWHPATTTCQGGWRPWDGQPVMIHRELVVVLTDEQRREVVAHVNAIHDG